MTTRRMKKSIALLTFVLWCRVEGILEVHTHVHKHLNGPDTVEPSKRNKDKGSWVPSAGDEALNPWLYRFPPWSENNPPPPSLALTNGEAHKSPNLRDISSFRRAPHQEDRFVFYDVKVDLDLPYVHEVIQTVLDNHGENIEDDDNNISFSEKENFNLYQSRDEDSPWKSRAANNVGRAIPEGTFPFSENKGAKFLNSKQNFGFGFSPSLVYQKNGGPELLVSYPEENYHGFREISGFIPVSPNVQFAEYLNKQNKLSLPFQEAEAVSKIHFPPSVRIGRHLTKGPKLRNSKQKQNKGLSRSVNPRGLNPRGLNPRISSTQKSGPIYPTSIQDIIHGQTSSGAPNSRSSVGSPTQIDPRNNKLSKNKEKYNLSRTRPNENWAWTDDNKSTNRPTRGS